MRSKWVKLRSWYYTRRRQQTRAVERETAIADDLVAYGGPGVPSRNSVHWLETMAKPVDPAYAAEVDPALIDRLIALVAEIEAGRP